MLRRVMMAGGASPSNAWIDLMSSLGPVMWLRMGEPSGLFIDSSGNGHHGTGTNSPARAQTAIYSNMGLSAGFSATNRYVSVADSAALRMTGDFTVGLAFRRAGAPPGAFPKLMWKPTDYVNGRANYAFLYVKSTNKVLFRVNASSSYYDATTSTTFGDDTSYLVIGRRSGTEVSVWTGSGTKEATAALPSSGTALDTSTSPVYIGGQSSNTNDQWSGRIDEPFLFNYALSDAEIASLFAARA